MTDSILRFPAPGAGRAAPGFQPYKFAPPVVDRGFRAHPQALVELTEGLQDPATVLIGPAGSGKTTLLASWVAQTSWTTGWLSVCPADVSAPRFIAHLCAAVRGVLSEPDYPLDGLLTYPEDVELPALLAEHVVIPLGRSGAQVAVVIDDFHRVQSSPRVRSALIWLFDHMPSGLHLIFAVEDDDNISAGRRDFRRIRLAARADLEFGPQNDSSLVILSKFDRVCEGLARAIGVQDFYQIAESSQWLTQEGPHSEWYGVHDELQKWGHSTPVSQSLHAQAAQWLIRQDHIFEGLQHHRLAGTHCNLDLAELAERGSQRGELFLEPHLLTNLTHYLAQSSWADIRRLLAQLDDALYRAGLYRTRADAQVGTYRIELLASDAQWSQALAEAERCLSIVDLLDDQSLRTRLNNLVRRVGRQVAPIYGPRPRLSARAYRVLKALQGARTLPKAAYSLGIGLGRARLYLAEAQDELGVDGPTQALRLLDPQHFE